jgi:hypothetical protein
VSATHDAALQRILAGREPVRIADTLRTLPRTANLELAIEVVLRLLAEPHWLAACGKLPARLIRGVLEAKATRPAHVFLQLAIPATAKAAPLKTAWQQAVEALRQLAETTHALDADARRAQLADLARTPQLLQAIQGVAANTAEVPVEMLVVLAIDGSETSLDALIPHLDLALGSRDARLERLALVRPFARSTPALDALFTELDGAVQARRSTSPALALAQAIGLGAVSQFRCAFLLHSVEHHQNAVPQIQGSLRIDSREDPYFRVELTRMSAGPDRSKDRRTWFDDTRLEDGLGVGRCEPADLPRWLRAAAKILNAKWDRFYLRTDVADPKRIERWLIV